MRTEIYKFVNQSIICKIVFGIQNVIPCGPDFRKKEAKPVRISQLLLQIKLMPSF